MAIRWKIFSALAFLYIMAIFFRVSLAVMARDISADFHLSALQLGTLSSMFFIVYALAQIPLGILLDRFGGKSVVCVLGIVTTAGSVLFALAPSYNLALVGRVLLGIGTSCVLMGSMKIFTNWFSRQEFAIISGFIMAIGNLGNLLATAPLAEAVTHFGWRYALLFVALSQVVATVLVYAVVTDAPSAMVLQKDGQAEDSSVIPVIKGLRLVLGNRSFWLIGLLGFCYYGNFMLIQSLWGGPYLMDVFGASRSVVGGILLYSAAGFITGCLCIGKISTHVLKSRKKTLLAGQAMTLGLYILLLGPAQQLSPAALKFLFFSIGFIASSGITVYPMVREMFPHALAGTALSTLNFFVVSGVAVIQLVAGIVLDRYTGVSGAHTATAYQHAFFLPFSGLAVALLLFVCAKDTLNTAEARPLKS
jgi:sugar phosphate permease